MTLKDKQDLLFDLDGTLTDPGPGITRGVQIALAHLGVQVEDLSALHCFIGPPMVDALQEYYGFTPEQAQEGLLKYREYYAATGMYENTPYPGIGEALEALAAGGKRLYVATSKPQELARAILSHFGLERHFRFMGGSGMDGSRHFKADVIRYVMEQCGIGSPGGCVMIGDRKYDVEGAKETGMACLGVLYGYGSREELEAAGADHLAPTVADLPRILL